MDEHFSLYMSPINLDPEQPAMPISHPSVLRDLSREAHRPVSRRSALPRTPGRSTKASPTTATFLQQTYDIDREREAMFFAALDRLRRGTLVCVFDATDRIQHMFWRYLDAAHPAAAGRDDVRAPRRDPRALPTQRRAGRRA